MNVLKRIKLLISNNNHLLSFISLTLSIIEVGGMFFAFSRENHSIENYCFGCIK